MRDSVGARSRTEVLGGLRARSAAHNPSTSLGLRARLLAIIEVQKRMFSSPLVLCALLVRRRRNTSQALYIYQRARHSSTPSPAQRREKNNPRHVVACCEYFFFIVATVDGAHVAPQQARDATHQPHRELTSELIAAAGVGGGGSDRGEGPKSLSKASRSRLRAAPSGP